MVVVLKQIMVPLMKIFLFMITCEINLHTKYCTDIQQILIIFVPHQPCIAGVLSLLSCTFVLCMIADMDERIYSKIEGWISPHSSFN